MFVRNSFKELVVASENITIADPIHRETFYDPCVLITPMSKLTGSVKFYVGAVLVKTVNFADEIKTASLVANSTELPYNVFPPTAKQALAFEDECGPSGEELTLSAVVDNSGADDVYVKAHFMSRIHP